MRTLIGALCALALAALTVTLNETPVSAHNLPCDFLTGGGWIIHPSAEAPGGEKGTFGVGGGCKHGSGTDGVAYWGHLEYHDHGTGLNVHWLDITAYDAFGPTSDGQQPEGGRFICGTARTNQSYEDVDFLVFANDKGEPGDSDEFWIRLSKNGVVVYTTQHDPYIDLGGPNPGGGNIQLHAPNPSTTGVFSDGLNPTTCPARFATE
jgi:hypothetical protein